LWLHSQGVAVRIVDQSAGPGETSRAMVVQARTLELYRQLGLAQAVVAAGHPATAMNLWAHGKHRARVDFTDAGANLTPYPFVTVYPQDQHERLLVDALAARGITVERNTALLSFTDLGTGVTARLRLPDGSEQDSLHAYLAGCDGARSVVRHQLGVGFEGGTYKHVFYVADVEAEGVAPEGEGHIAFDEGDFALLLPYGHNAGRNGQKRLIGTVRDARAEQAETLAFDDVRQDAIRHLGLQVHKVNWFSTYRVHHRVADQFQRGRVFLLGDAAHIHSPAGGQGMNTGILDANNLAWKLAAVLHGRAAPALLDSYGQERQAFARKLVATTDRLFTLATSEGNLADFIKTHVVPAVASLAFKVEDVRELMFKTVSQITLEYRDSALSHGKAGEVRGGDRLPWLAEVDNASAPGAIGWQVQVYGTASGALQAWCATHGVALNVFAWRQEYSHRGLAQNAVYLLRPDSWVGLADAEGSVAALDAYLTQRGLALHGLQ
jgi:2-polyprenyl-6-methoxyphenol hydroxylase-like FAD-dependent oxidoreductase